MLGFLDTKVTLRHLLILGVIVAVPSMGAGALAAGGLAQRPVQRRFGAHVVVVEPLPQWPSTSLDAPKRILQTSFTVPAGKTADLQATFSANMQHQTDGSAYAYCSAEFTVDHAPPDTTFKPGLDQLLGALAADEPESVGVSMSGYRLGRRTRPAHRQRLPRRCVRGMHRPGSGAQRAHQYPLTCRGSGSPRGLSVARSAH